MSAVVAADPGPMARLEAVCADASAPGEVFRRLTDGERLNGIAKAWGVPKGRFSEWFLTKHEALYDAALKVRAAELALDALDAAEGAPRQAVSPAGAPLFDNDGKPILEVSDVARDKLRADVALKLAGKWDRERYGEKVKVERDVRLVADAGLIGTMGELLKMATDRRPLVLEQRKAVAVDAEPVI